MVQRGINVAIGTDGNNASNYSRPDARHVPRRRSVQGRPPRPADVPGRDGLRDGHARRRPHDAARGPDRLAGARARRPTSCSTTPTDRSGDRCSTSSTSSCGRPTGAACTPSLVDGAGGGRGRGHCTTIDEDRCGPTRQQARRGDHRPLRPARQGEVPDPLTRQTPPAGAAVAHDSPVGGGFKRSRPEPVESLLHSRHVPSMAAEEGQRTQGVVLPGTTRRGRSSACSRRCLTSTADVSASSGITRQRALILRIGPCRTSPHCDQAFVDAQHPAGRVEVIPAQGECFRPSEPLEHPEAKGDPPTVVADRCEEPGDLLAFHAPTFNLGGLATDLGISPASMWGIAHSYCSFAFSVTSERAATYRRTTQLTVSRVATRSCSDNERGRAAPSAARRTCPSWRGRCLPVSVSMPSTRTDPLVALFAHGRVSCRLPAHRLAPDTSLIRGSRRRRGHILRVQVDVVGEGGLEPPASCTQSRCATTALLPGGRRAYRRARAGRPASLRPSLRGL